MPKAQKPLCMSRGFCFTAAYPLGGKPGKAKTHLRLGLDLMESVHYPSHMKTPQMQVGTVEMVDVEWIMQNATDSVDGFSDYDGVGVDYDELVRNKATDYSFGNLIATILDRGFRVPIVLVRNFHGDPESVVHGNGHHRMAAAILLCLSEIPVYWADGKTEGYMVPGVSDSEGLLYATVWETLAEELSEVFYA